MHPKIEILGSIFEPHSGSFYDHNQAQDTNNSRFLAFVIFLKLMFGKCSGIVLWPQKMNWVNLHQELFIDLPE